VNNASEFLFSKILWDIIFSVFTGVEERNTNILGRGELLMELMVTDFCTSSCTNHELI
jgi:hypothetical protein